MVQHEVHIDLDSLIMGGFDKILEISLRAVQIIDLEIVVHVICVIRRGGMCRRKPQRGHSQVMQIVQTVPDSIEVSNTIIVAVREGINQQLIRRRRALIAVERGWNGNDISNGHT